MNRLRAHLNDLQGNDRGEIRTKLLIAALICFVFFGYMVLVGSENDMKTPAPKPPHSLQQTAGAPELLRNPT